MNTAREQFPAGLSEAEAARRLAAEGPNTLPDERRRGWVAIAGEAAREPMFLLLIGAFPAWPYSSGWGYYPAGGIGLILLIVIILALIGRL